MQPENAPSHYHRCDATFATLGVTDMRVNRATSNAKVTQIQTRWHVHYNIADLTTTDKHFVPITLHISKIFNRHRLAQNCPHSHSPQYTKRCKDPFNPEPNLPTKNCHIRVEPVGCLWRLSPCYLASEVTIAGRKEADKNN